MFQDTSILAQMVFHAVLFSQNDPIDEDEDADD